MSRFLFVIGTTIVTPASTAAAFNASSPRTKVFTVRPITSWIDKLASQHGSPTSTHSDGNGATIKTKTYQKRELVLKKMQDSYTEIILPFAKDKALLEEYINFRGTVRYEREEGDEKTPLVFVIFFFPEDMAKSWRTWMHWQVRFLTSTRMTVDKTVRL